MTDKTETNSRGYTLPYRIERRYIGQLADDATEQDVNDCCRFAVCDVALELRGENLELFLIKVRDTPKVTHALWGNKHVVLTGYN